MREKVNETLSKIAGGVAQLYRKSRGRVRIDLDKRIRKFHLFEPGDLDTRKSTGTSCQIEIHFMIKTTEYLL